MSIDPEPLANETPARRPEDTPLPLRILTPRWRAIFLSVLRRLSVVLCAVVLLQGTNLGSLLVGAECFERCADDTAPGHCLPICVSCPCGTHANPLPPRATRLPTPASVDSCRPPEAVFSGTDIHLPDILHVPKLLLT